MAPALQTIARPPMRSLRSNNNNNKEKEKEEKEKKQMEWDWADLIGSA